MQTLANNTANRTANRVPAAYLLPGYSLAVDRTGRVGEKTGRATLAQLVEQLIRNQ